MGVLLLRRIAASAWAIAVLVPRAPAVAQAPAASARFAGARPPEILRSMHQSARNLLGILEYRRDQDAVGDEVVTLHRAAVAGLPPFQVEGLDAAEDAGRRGILLFDGSKTPFADSAKGQGTGVAGGCKNLARTAQAQAGVAVR